jgi:hypothetical protein
MIKLVIESVRLATVGLRASSYHLFVSFSVKVLAMSALDWPLGRRRM